MLERLLVARSSRGVRTRRRGVAGALAFALLASQVLAAPLFVAPVSAQSAACEIPPAAARVVASTTMTPTPTPPATSDAASPAASPAAGATPVAPAPTPDPNAAIAPEIDALARAITACMSAGDSAGVAELATERYLGQLYGGGEPMPREEYLRIGPELNVVPVRLESINQITLTGPGQATANVLSVVGNQLLRERWQFVEAPAGEQRRGETPWRIDGAAPITIPEPRDATELDVTLADYTIAVDGDPAIGPDVILRGANEGGEDHEMLVLRFVPGYTTADLLRAAGPALPDEVTYIGQATVPAGRTADLLLVDLEPGVYTVVCLLPGPRGTPHLALGMAATFTVGDE